MFGCYIVSIIMNIFLNWILLFLSCIKKSKQYIRDMFYILVDKSMDRVGIMLCVVAFFVGINVYTLFAVNKTFLKDDKISSKKFIWGWILSQIISMAISYSVVIWLLSEIVWDIMIRILFVLFYILVELFIVRYWLKISREKSILVSLVPIFCIFPVFLRSFLTVSMLFIIRNIFWINDKISKETVVIVWVILAIVISLLMY